jgi:hypothetical protein
MTTNELGLGVTRKGYVYNTNKLTEEEQREACVRLLEEIRLAGCTVTFVNQPTGSVLELYKVMWTGARRLIDSYRETTPLGTVYRAYLDRHCEPASAVEQESFRAALFTCGGRSRKAA